MFDDELEIETLPGEPHPKLVITKQERYAHDHPYLSAAVSMKCGDAETDLDSARRVFWDATRRQWQLRDASAEQKLLGQLTSFPFQETHSY